ncbi:DNA endonuclease [Peribacillus sp. NPDC096379]|uniref:DNA endonuclease n=1 Tax=Peribacillus sp. NPDC096379 TaxID=3364393 RepID=UPI00380ACCA3
MNILYSLTDIQFNVLIASILGDGEITKIYKNSRRKNHSYREHYGVAQEDYRKWKISFFEEILYLTPRSCSVRSSSLPLFTTLHPHFYTDNGTKQIPLSLLKSCNLPHFPAILFMDDGSLSISHRINHQKKLIYLIPHIYLYLQCYSLEELTVLKLHFNETFGVVFHLSARNDGQGFILKTTSVKETYQFLGIISPVTTTCDSMYYKTSWEYRFAEEKKKWQSKLPDYHLIASSSERSKPYSEAEITRLIELKERRWTTQKIADDLQRSYWSVTAKWSDINKSQ